MKLTGIAIFLILAGCTATESQIREVLEKNPDLVFGALEKNPEKFAELSRRAMMEARRKDQEQAAAREKAQLEASLKNPLVPEIGPDRAVVGKRNAPIVVVAYSDFQCPYCRKGYETVEELKKKYGDRLLFVFKHLPLSFHPLALPAAKRFEAIALQSAEKAYRFHDEVFKDQKKLGAEGEAFLDAAAKRAGADVARMKKDLDSGKVTARIDADVAEAKQFGITGTPGFIVNGIPLKGARPVAAFEQILRQRNVAGISPE